MDVIEGVEPVDNVFMRIRANYDTLSRRQRKVADFILRQGIDAVHFSAAQIATLTDVDRSTVTRTAQTLGYEGFPDLQNALRGQLMGQTRMADRMLSAAQHLADDLEKQVEGQGATSILSRMVRFEFEHVGELLLQIPDAQIEAAAELIDQARTVYILGFQYAAPLAMMMSTLIGFTRSDYVLLDSNAIHLTKQLDAMTADDVLFAFAFNPLVQEALRCMTFARTVGARTIILTDTSLSSAALLADLVLVAPTHVWSNGYSLAPFALMNAIYSALIMRGGNEVRERIERLGRIDEYLGVFETKQE